MKEHITRVEQLERLKACENVFAVGWTSGEEDEPPRLVQAGDVQNTTPPDLMYSLSMGIITLFDNIEKQTGITYDMLREWLVFALENRPEDDKPEGVTS